MGDTCLMSTWIDYLLLRKQIAPHRLPNAMHWLVNSGSPVLGTILRAKHEN